jgi:4-amino-4-deoxy-L-arabinose transferase-like glycosyltransferase
MAEHVTFDEPAVAELGARRRGALEAARGRLPLRHLAVVPALALAATLDTVSLAQNGYANLYYSAGVKSMLASWHRFFFLSFDPGGLISIDKPPLGLWLQAGSAELFGFRPLSLLLPEVVCAVLALAAAPSFVAVSRDNNIDTPLILLMVLACGAGLRACETGRLRTLLLAAALAGLAFNVKGLAAFLIVPGIALGYLVCAPGARRRRLLHVGAAVLALATSSFAWIAVVEATPSSQRPFVGGSTDNSELGLTFSYNGFGRIGGQLGGPGPSPQFGFAPARAALPAVRRRAAARIPVPAPNAAPAVKQVITRNPISFGRGAGPLRLFQHGFGDQGAWLLPFALAGLLAAALSRPGRRDPRLAALIVLGGFFLVEAAALSFSEGIVHPYYVSALAPGSAAMVGVGLAATPRFRRRGGAILAAAAIVASAIVQALMLFDEHYIEPWAIALLVLAALAALMLLTRAHWHRQATALALAALLVAPAAYSSTTWDQPTEGTFPAAGPNAAGGYGGVGVSAPQLAATNALIRYVVTHRPGRRFELLTEASLTAATPILLGLRAAALGGYGGIDPALDGPGLGRLVARGDARYVLIGGGYAYLGGNKASRAAQALCPQVPRAAWSGGHALGAAGLYLLDCRDAVGALGRQPA